jgi:hypothetical protein
MNNVADGTLLDVRGYCPGDVVSDALDIALRRLVSSSTGCNFNSFNSSI